MNRAEFEIAVSEGKVLVDFYTGWCGPCKVLARNLKEAAPELDETGVKVLKIDVDEAGELASHFKISYVPHVMYFVNGAMKAKFMGVKDKDGLLEFIKENSSEE